METTRPKEDRPLDLDLERLKELRRQGWSYRELAGEFGVSAQTVMRLTETAVPAVSDGTPAVPSEADGTPEPEAPTERMPVPELTAAARAGTIVLTEAQEQAVRDYWGYASSERRTLAERDAVAARIVAAAKGDLVAPVLDPGTAKVPSAVGRFRVPRG